MDTVTTTTSFFLPENLRALRKRLNWSQEELAEKIGLNRGNIASYENGTAEPKICNLMKLANLFNVSVFDITHGNLKEEEYYQRASQRHLNGSNLWHLHSVEHYIKEAEDLQNVIKGLQCLFKLNVKKTGELPADLQFVKDQFEQLSSVANHLLNSHLELISFIKNNCNGHGEIPEDRQLQQA